MAIESFTGPHRFLSNFYHSPIQINEYRFNTVEHAYQAAKSIDYLKWDAFTSNTRFPMSAGQAKKAGQKLELRPDWDEIKLDIMHTLVDTKFAQNEDLRKLLIDTYPVELIEGNYWGDRYWGMCRGIGHNYLGKILMAVRRQYI